MSFNNIFFILNKPQLSENIGACARAMKNFNFSNLIIINPKTSFPNDKIFATSVGAKVLTLKQAIIVAGVFEFLGAFLMGSHVTSTIRKKIVRIDM